MSRPVLAAFGALLLIGCADEGECPSDGDVLRLVEPGSYTADGGRSQDRGCDEEDGCAIVFTPHEGVSPIAMTVGVDRVVMRYERGGEEVVETWRIARRRYDRP